MPEYEKFPLKEVDLEFNDIGTEGGKSWDNNFRIVLRSVDNADTVDSLIQKAHDIIAKYRKTK